MIRVQNLVFNYPGRWDPTIKDISFQIQPGEIFGFLGPSGAGKSTTQRILIGILKRYTGSVQVMGTELSETDTTFYERIGVSFEFPNLYSRFTALENLKFFASLYQGKTSNPWDLLELVGLTDHAHKRVADFSKGMRMRLNFIRSLLNKPDILFLDEPTSSLDPVNSRNIREIIKDQQREGTTIFLTTHDMHVAAELCNRVAFIVDGKIPLIDSPKKLMSGNEKKQVRVSYLTDDTEAWADFPQDSLGENREFLRLLSSGNIQSIHTLETTLEDVFIAVTGRKLV